MNQYILQVLQYCVQDKALVNKQLPNGRFPLCVAADYGQKDVIEYLVSQGADVNVCAK